MKVKIKLFREMTANCIYCKSRLSDKGSSVEHIIPAALGYDETIDCVCKPCNDLFGHTIDKVLIEPFDLYRVLFNVRDRDGKVPKVYAKVETGCLAGRRLGYNKDGLVAPMLIKVGGETYRSFGDFDKDQLEQKLTERRGGARFEKIDEGTDSGLFRTPHGFEFLASREGLRGALKICLNYLASKIASHDTGLLLGEALDPIRSFVRGDSDLHCNQISLPLFPAQTGIPFHTLLLSLDPALGVIHSATIFFDFVGVYALLAEHYRGEAYAFGVAIDPTARKAAGLSSGEKIRHFLSSVFRNFTDLKETRKKLNAYKVYGFEEAVSKLNKYFQSNGIKHTIRTR